VTADPRVIARVHELIDLYGQTVRFGLRYAVAHPTTAPDEELVGELIGVAQRFRGGPDWQGKQWDVVIRQPRGDGHILRTFAASRIRTVTIEREKP
jgi:hypothetical protein